MQPKSSFVVKFVWKRHRYVLCRLNSWHRPQTAPVLRSCFTKFDLTSPAIEQEMEKILKQQLEAANKDIAAAKAELDKVFLLNQTGFSYNELMIIICYASIDSPCTRYLKGFRGRQGYAHSRTRGRSRSSGCRADTSGPQRIRQGGKHNYLPPAK